MTLSPMNSSDPLYRVSPKVNSKIDVKNNEPNKSTQVFKEVSEAKQEDSEREYYVKDIMQQKGVSREVAEAEYDFFS
jgi:hypothetical protein